MDVVEGLTLSRQAHSLWAKTGRNEDRHLHGTLSVHLSDTAEMARMLWRRWLPEATKRYVQQQLGLGTEEAETLLVWLAAMHDIGKATPSFQSKVDDLAEAVRVTGLFIPRQCENYSHAFMGEVLVHSWLVGKGWTDKGAQGYASVVGGHHGGNPSKEDLKRIRYGSQLDSDRTLGAVPWEHVQIELLDWLFTACGAERLNKQFKETILPRYAQVLLTGMVIMADWIASNTELFPLLGRHVGWDECALRAEKAWNKLDLPSRVEITPSHDDVTTLFMTRFPGLPENAHLRPIQREAVAALRENDDPSLVIIEAPMGEGKTEAALLCAELLCEQYACGGLAYLLPTQATSNAMFTRVRGWLESVIEHQPTDLRQDIHLLHGKAELNEEFASLQRWSTSWMGDGRGTEDPIIVHQWFSGRKRGLLAPFVVGTVDQLLMAALNARHVHLRHLGLSGKVVVIDEVHAYDAYMSLYLDRVLEYLGGYHVPTVILSATLPPSRRNELIQAYRGHSKRGSLRKVVHEDAPRLESGAPAYPLITTVAASNNTLQQYRAVRGSGRCRDVSLEYLPDDDEMLVAKLEVSLKDGGCVCVLRDTVARAQSTYRLLKNRLDVEVKLVHARFIAIDRARNDGELVQKLGARAEKRPEALVVVATQVVEQSLDLDFDLLITDIAPVDLLLQRMGRLHRHARGEGECKRPPMLRQARCVITGVDDWNEDLPKFSKGIERVYQPAILWRTIVALRKHAEGQEGVRLPQDISSLVERVYESLDTIDSPTFGNACRELEKEKYVKEASAKTYLLRTLGSFRQSSLDGWMDGPLTFDGEVRGRAAVRDSEESLEVVVVQQTAQGYEVLPWVAEQLGIDSELGTGREEPPNHAARAAATCTVNLPLQMSAPYVRDDVVRALEQSGTFDGWQRSGWLAGSLPLVLDESGEAFVSSGRREFHVRYTREVGLEVIGERKKGD